MRNRNRDNDLGRAIAMLRGARTQAEVAERAGIDPGTWSEYETGRRRPREGNLAKILAGLGSTRLELEEAVWGIRRTRLLQEHALATERRHAPPSLLPPPAEPGAEAEPQDLERDSMDPARRQLRAQLGRLAAAAEEILVMVMRGGL